MSFCATEKDVKYAVCGDHDIVQKSAQFLLRERKPVIESHDTVCRD